MKHWKTRLRVYCSRRETRGPSAAYKKQVDCRFSLLSNPLFLSSILDIARMVQFGQLWVIAFAALAAAVPTRRGNASCPVMARVYTDCYHRCLVGRPEADEAVLGIFCRIVLHGQHRLQGQRGEMWRRFLSLGAGGRDKHLG